MSVCLMSNENGRKERGRPLIGAPAPNRDGRTDGRAVETPQCRRRREEGRTLDTRTIRAARLPGLVRYKTSCLGEVPPHVSAGCFQRKAEIRPDKGGKLGIRTNRMRRWWWWGDDESGTRIMFRRTRPRSGGGAKMHVPSSEDGEKLLLDGMPSCPT